MTAPPPAFLSYRVLPVVLSDQSRDGVPDFLLPTSSTVYAVREFTVAGAEELLRVLLRRPAETEPPIGQAPELGARPAAARSPSRSWLIGTRSR